MMPDRVVLATANAGKVRELGAMVRAWGVARLESLAEHPAVAMPEETGETYAENAALKARAVAAATGVAALADDSGLEVDALGGAPGVRSARYAPTDAERIARLLTELERVPSSQRTARFRCAVVLATPSGAATIAEGTCEGRILEAPTGDRGFGYDPIFWSDDLGRPFGVATAEEKAAVSHRARAMQALGTRLGAAGA